ncbi:MAG TPA: DNA-processing protein DprA [Flavobacterium sp.]|nr:DNA-processing protein DprA [Flavobacterium sp.]
MDSNQLFHTLALMRTEGIGDISAKKLLAHFGSAEQMFSATKKDFKGISRFNKSLAENILNKSTFKRAEQEVLFVEREQLKTHFYQGDDYPEKLRHCADAPILLFSSGDFDMKNPKVLSIVGTRKSTSYGVSFCKELLRDLASLNPLIVSGFAFGTDISAHLAALDNKLQTVGVLAHGFDRIYPAEHKKHIAKMNQSGGFLTEFWSESTPVKENFVRRNRIVAGISEATIVIESASKGGSLITANLANDYSREVFAVPGKVTDFYSQGCNDLIRTQRANLITSAQDVLYLLNWDLSIKKEKVIQKELFLDLDPEQKKIYDHLQTHGKDLLDMIARSCEMPVYKVASVLFDLELKGLIRPLQGKMFEVIS